MVVFKLPPDTVIFVSGDEGLMGPVGCPVGMGGGGVESSSGSLVIGEG